MYRDERTNRQIKSIVGLLVLVFVLVVMVTIATGEVVEDQMAAQADKSVAGAEADVNSSGADVSTGDMIQLIKFNKDQPIKDALRVLSARYKKNIVPSPSVDGILGFTTLTDVTFEEAMAAVLGDRLKYEQKGNLTRVYTAEEYKKLKEDTERMVHKVFTLYYLTSDEAEKLLKPVLSSAGKFSLSTGAESKISQSGGGGGAGGGGSLNGGGGGDSMALNDTIVMYDFPENVLKAEDILKALDVRPKQVLVEATILRALLTEEMDLGVDLNLLAGVSLDGTADIISGSVASTPIRQVGNLTGGGTPMEVSGFTTTGGNGLRVGIRSGDAVAFITALESVTDTTVIANPKILAVNKQEGSVLIGSNLGYRSSTTVAASGTATTGEVKFLQTGTQLVFRPYIGSDGYIRMDIYPKDSTATLNSDGVPDETTTELRTNIIVKDGETIVIGGLFRDVVTSTKAQVPLLGDIPLIGALFRGTTDQTQREEVIILLTPHIIDSAGQTDGAARAEDISRKRYGARKELQSINRSRFAEDHYIKAVQYYTDGNNVESLSELNDALDLYPAYLEAIRLKEKIVSKMSPDEAKQIERIMVGVIEREEAPKWKRQ